MIPDKIYIPRYPDYKLGERLGDEWMYEPHKEVNNAEYIRKDAILEWIISRRKDALKALEFYKDKGEVATLLAREDEIVAFMNYIEQL